MTEKTNIGVIGAGLMGHAIALSFARAGHSVKVHDPAPESLASLKLRVRTSLSDIGHSTSDIETVLERITTSDSLAGAVVDAGYVTEAGPEKLEVKWTIFAALERHAPADSILASNTSVISISRIAEAVTDRSRVVGTHWWNPGHMIPLVEIIRTEWVDDAVMDRTEAILTNIGKSPVRVEKDVPGFIGNRLQHALWREAISLVERGICSAEAVDMVVKSSFGRRLAVLGPLENADLIGTDLTLDIHENVLFDLESRRGPSPYLRQLVADGRLGMKSGQGFRSWTEEERAETRAGVAQHLKRLEGLLKH
ncbi:3-hydroxyacyl-CoA dehydrogenase family protein [Devosia sp.]|uniref:3-hydroxyacyl-CoA dehydrogenase family protein n=1 Tax=Devosia sp. TaxID=1871048 RepID=UPI0027338C17|nr:3-hydroxyacyl-CoA dehydrogenase NAD-binding domain-containing protein [Devosia sp.]MDP2780596.1 3-hydroxyacyl-CoA dehydrogenase NAD-binding domain-containing protein [Devosia sp.]